MDKEKALKNLIDVSKILKAHDITYWLEAGTCLGAYRENDFISHDVDIDLGIMAEDCMTIDELLPLFGSFLYNGFRIYHTFGELNKGFEIALWRDGIKIDVFWFYLKGDKRWMACWLNGGRGGEKDMIKLVFNKELFEKKEKKSIGNLNLKVEKELETIKFKGHNFPIPYPIEDYLIARYGENWKTPDPRWRWDKPFCRDDNFNIN